MPYPGDTTVLAKHPDVPKISFNNAETYEWVVNQRGALFVEVGFGRK